MTRIFKDMELVEQLGSGVCKYANLTAEGVRSNLVDEQTNKFDPIAPSPHQKYDAIVLGVAHKQFINLDLNPLKKKLAVVYDVKGVLDEADMKL